MNRLLYNISILIFFLSFISMIIYITNISLPTPVKQTIYDYKISKEYDGFRVPNEDGNDYYCVFQSTQIKLADGSNTTFDGSNPDIRYAEGGKTNLSRPYSSLDISRVKKGVVQLHSVHPKRITKIDDLPI